MVRVLHVTLITVLVATAAPAVRAQETDPGRLYGSVRLMNGREYTGFIRWDLNEGHWTDILNASKRLSRRHLQEADDLRGRSRSGERSLRVLGMDIAWGGNRYSSSAQGDIRMGHIARLEVLDEDYALITLRSGQEQELRRSSTDLGRSNRGIIVASTAGDTELEWMEIDAIDFGPAPRGTEAPMGQRLFGTLETNDGDAFTGWITWDMDEIFGGDKLDGRDDGRRESLLFSEIASIERASSSRALVTLRSGEERSMRGTNDVNSENRGILVGDPGLGQIKVSWRDFARVSFQVPTSDAMSYSAFEGAGRITGTVFTETGEALTGTIRWNNDEQWNWEMLDGEYKGLELDVEFGLVQSITKASSRNVDILLRDGRTIDLRGSNGVNSDNRGIFVEQASGETVLVLWDDFERLELVH